MEGSNLEDIFAEVSRSLLAGGKGGEGAAGGDRGGLREVQEEVKDDEGAAEEEELPAVGEDGEPEGGAGGVAAGGAAEEESSGDESSDSSRGGDAQAAAAAAAALVGDKRGRTHGSGRQPGTKNALKPEARWKVIVLGKEGEYKWVDFEDSAKDRFVQGNELICKWCTTANPKTNRGKINARKWTNVRAHLITQMHLSADPANKKLVKGQTSLLASGWASPAAAIALGDDAHLLKLRAMVALEGVPFATKSNLPALLGPGSLLLDSATLLNKRFKGITPGTVASALSYGVDMFFEQCKDELKGRSVWIGFDEATSHVEGGSHPMILMIGCEEIWEEPICAGLIFGADDSAEDESGDEAGAGGGPPPLKPSQIAAQRIEGRLVQLGIDKAKQCTVVVGDNARFVDAVAKYLRVPRLRCGPHGLALVWVAVITGFELFTAITSGVSAVLSAGGGMRRKDAARRAGLNVSKLHCVTTRWGDTDKVAAYLMEVDEARVSNFDKLRNLLRDDEAFIPRNIREVDDIIVVAGPQRRGEKLSSVLDKVRFAFEVDVADASRTKEAILQYKMVCMIAPKITELIAMFSARVGNMDFVACTDALTLLNKQITDAAFPATQALFVDKALASIGVKAAPAYRKSVSTETFILLKIRRQECLSSHLSSSLPSSLPRSWRSTTPSSCRLRATPSRR